MNSQSPSYFSRILLRKQFASLESLIVYDVDHLLFNEVANCLMAGATRSAFITTWLCAAASIRNKLEIISTRDSQVGSRLKLIEQAEKDSRSIDKMLLDSALEFGMVTSDDHTNLENIRAMRNVYAHPKKVAPTFEEVLGALSSVTRIVLSKHGLLRYGYVSNIIKGIFEERHFLDDVDDRVIEFGQEFALRIDPEIYPWVYSKIIENLEPIWDDPSMSQITQRGRFFLQGFLLETTNYLHDKSWRIIDIARDNPKSTSICLSNPNTWINLPQQAREIIVGYLTESIVQMRARGLVRTRSHGPLPTQAYNSAKLLLDNNVVDGRERQRIESAIKNAPIYRQSQFGISITNWFDQVIDSLESYDWYVQNPAIGAIMDAGPTDISNLSKQNQEILGRNVLQAAEGQSNSAEHFIETISNQPLVYPSNFIQGLLFECFFNESLVYRTKFRKLPEVMKCVLERQNIDSTEIIDNLTESLSKSLPDRSINSRFEFDNALRIIYSSRVYFRAAGNKENENIISSIENLNKLLEKLTLEHNEQEDVEPF